MILRFANTTFFWLLISYGQYLLKYLVYEQFFVEPPEQLFIDFCTIAKVFQSFDFDPSSPTLQFCAIRMTD